VRILLFTFLGLVFRACCDNSAVFFTDIEELLTLCSPFASSGVEPMRLLNEARPFGVVPFLVMYSPSNSDVTTRGLEDDNPFEDFGVVFKTEISPNGDAKRGDFGDILPFDDRGVTFEKITPVNGDIDWARALLFADVGV